MLRLVLSVLLCGATSMAFGKVKTKLIEYKEGDVLMEGYLAYDDAIKAKRPGILVVHAWMGLNDHVRTSAENLAKLGYVAFAADIYGKGIRPSTMEDAAKTSGYYKENLPILRARVKAAHDVLKKFAEVNAGKTAAIGYCFGGTTVLELARSGEKLSGVVSFHGGLKTKEPATTFNTKILALHGADDPFVPADEVTNFQSEMRKANADWEFISYGGAVHSFTHKDAGSDNSKGQAYNKSADERSWIAMKDFFKEIF